MRIVVTGSSGFVGRHLLRRLVAEGHVLTAVTRRQSAGTLEAGIARKIEVDDLACEVPDVDAMSGHDMVIHLAANIRQAGRAASPEASETASMTRNIAQAARDAGIPRFLLVSSMSATLAQAKAANARAYGFEKLAAERIAVETLDAGQHLLILRPPAIYGAGMTGSLGTLAALVRRGLPIPLGLAKARRSYLAIENLGDLVAAIARMSDGAWQSLEGQQFEPDDGNLVATDDIVRAIAAHLGRKARLVPVPLFLLRLAGAMTGRRDLISGAIDPLATSGNAVLSRETGWEPAVAMPESLKFLARP